MFFTALGKWLLDKLSLKTVGILIGLAVLGFGAWSLYHAIYERGVASQAKIISDLTTKFDKADASAKQAKADLASYQKQFADWQKQENLRDAELKAQQDDIIQNLTDQLSDYDKKLTQVNKVKNDLSKYISKANDAGCIIPAGFMQLYNKSLAGKQGYLVSLPTGSIAYAPTGLSLTDVAGVVLDNNTAASRNRELVLAWQNWYTLNKSAFEKFKATPPPAPIPSTQEKPTSSPTR